MKLVKRNLKKFIAFCLSVMMCMLAFCNNTQATILEDPIIFLNGNDNYSKDENGMGDFDDTIYFSDIKSYYQYGNPNAIVVEEKSFYSLSNFKSMLEIGNYIWVSTHGSVGHICTYDEDGNLNGRIYASDIKGSSGNYSNVELCVLLACESAKGDDNVCKAIYNKGAKCVIGFEECIDVQMAREWQCYFAEAQAVGWTVAAAMRYADSKVYTGKSSYDCYLNSYGGLDCRVVYGNSNLRYTKE